MIVNIFIGRYIYSFVQSSSILFLRLELCFTTMNCIW